MHRPKGVSVAAAIVAGAALAAPLFLAACGDDATDTSAGAADPTHDHASGHHEHALFELPDGVPEPTIDVDVEPDPVSGVNVHVDVSDFDIAPERASTEAVAGEGHFHVYVDGQKVARFYNQSIHLPVSEGEHTVMVELSANDHSTYTLDGVPISDQTEVSVPTAAEGHRHHDPVESAGPAPAIDVTVNPDPRSGWNVHADVANLTFAPRSAGLDHVDGEGHLHLYVDGVKVSRLYGEWWHLDPLPAGEHEITVEATTNGHAPYAVDGEPIAASVTIDVTEEQGAEAAMDGDAMDGQNMDGHTMDGDPREADTVIEIDITDGSVNRDDTRFTVEEGSTVGLIVTTDAADRVHVHGYELLTAVGPDEPAELLFTAERAGLFEVELEDSGLFLFDLQVG